MTYNVLLRLYNIPYVCLLHTTFCFYIHSLVNIGCFLSFGSDACCHEHRSKTLNLLCVRLTYPHGHFLIREPHFKEIKEFGVTSSLHPYVTPCHTVGTDPRIFCSPTKQTATVEGYPRVLWLFLSQLQRESPPATKKCPVVMRPERGTPSRGLSPGLSCWGQSSAKIRKKSRTSVLYPPALNSMNSYMSLEENLPLEGTRKEPSQLTSSLKPCDPPTQTALASNQEHWGSKYMLLTLLIVQQPITWFSL